MKKIYLSTALVLSAFAADAQNVQGFVWQDRGVFDGLYDDGTENTLPGILVELWQLNGGDPIMISAAISNADGSFDLVNSLGIGEDFYLQYRYPTGVQPTFKREGADNDINSAVTISTGQTDLFDITSDTEPVTGYNLGLKNQANEYRIYCTNKPSTTTTWSETLTLPKADPLVGELVTAHVFTAGVSFHSTIGIENTGASPDDIELSVGAEIQITSPGVTGTSSRTNTEFYYEEAGIPAFDGEEDYGGASGRTLSDQYGSGYRNVSVGGFFLPSYEGPGDLSISATTKSATTILGGGNFETSVSTEASAGFCVVYEYAAGALPVIFISFDAEATGTNAVELQWITSLENENKGFYIEKSTDGRTFRSIGYLPAQTTTGTNGLNTYQFTDHTPDLNGNNYYRIRQVDLGTNKETYTEIEVVSFKNGSLNNRPVLYPNPATTDVINVEHLAGNETIRIYDIQGRMVLLQEATGSNNLELNIESLLKGSYILNIVSGQGELESIPFVKK